MRLKEFRGVIFVLLAATLWGGLGPITNFMSGYRLSAYDIALVRLGVGAHLLGGVIMVRGGGQFRIGLRGLVFCGIIGLISQGLFNIFFFNAVIRIGITAGVVMLYTSPAFALIFTRIFRRSRLTFLKITAILLTFTGSYLTVTGGRGLSMNMDLLGIVMGLLAGATYGALPVFNSFISGREDNLTIMFYSFAAGALVVLPFAEPRSIVREMVAAPELLGAGVVLGLLPTIVSHFVFLEAGKVLEAFKVSLLANFEVVVAASLAYWIFNENLGGVKIAGIILVITGSVIPNIPFLEKKTLEKKFLKSYNK